MHLIWVRRETKYFCKGDWTGNLTKHELICPSGSRNNFATNAPHEKPNRKFKMSWFDARRGDTKCAANAGRLPKARGQ